MTRLLIIALGLLLSNAAPVVGSDSVNSPDDVAVELLKTYGKQLKTVTYIPALAVANRWRFAQFTNSEPERRLVLGLLPEQPSVPKSHVEFAGHLVYAEIARTSDGALRDKCLAAVRHAADQLLDSDRQTVRVPGRQEMSDAVFMCGPILCEAGSLTGEARYFDAAIRYLAEMRRLRMREDGLYRHGHFCDAAWGRGNGFPAVGVAWCLTRLPENHTGRDDLLAAFRRHIEVLAKHQTANGTWRQVIDVPEAYEEFSATAMIGFAMQRGMTLGWLDRKASEPVIERAWQAVCRRIEPGGKIIDVCEGTGTQKSLEDYLQRKAIRGVDDRGGAMGLLFAVERACSK